MTVENEKLLKVIKDIRLTVLADNRVDADEARELLRIAERYAPENADMARFAVMLKDILADGIVDRDESRRIADYLNWLVRETVARNAVMPAKTSLRTSARFRLRPKIFPRTPCSGSSATVSRTSQLR